MGNTEIASQSVLPASLHRPSLGDAELTMSSREIADLVEKRHDHVLRDVRTMLVGLYGDDEVADGMPDKDMFEVFCDRMGWGISSPKLGNKRIQGVSVSRDSRGYISEICLDYNHTMTLISGYSVRLRKTIIDRWHQLESEAKPSAISIPDFSDPAAAARAWADQFEARRIAERTKAEIGSRREATAMNTASQAVKKANKLELELDRARDYPALSVCRCCIMGRSFRGVS